MYPDPQVLATDLDGTLIPLADNRENQQDLRRLTEFLLDRGLTLVFVTGRHFESVMAARDQHSLPPPDWIICDVGTSIHARHDDGRYCLVGEYMDHQAQIVATLPIAELRRRMMSFPDLRLQEDEKQGRFKLSYYCDAARISMLTDAIQKRLQDWDAPYSMIASVDPFNGDGLVDLLPRGVSKAHALDWWSQKQSIDVESVLFAGDSGNDLAAMTAGYRTIVVGNADPMIVDAARDAHKHSGWSDRLIRTSKSATSGVLEGCRWFCRNTSGC